jgi:hypothetical protein
LRQLATTVHTFHGWAGKLPPAIGNVFGQDGTLHFHILPFLEGSRMGLPPQTKKDLIAAFIATDPNSPGLGHWEGEYGYTNFPVNWLALHGGPQKNGKWTFEDSFPDGKENTVLFALRYAMCNGTPTLWSYDQYDPKAPLIGYYNKDMFQVQPSQQECNAKVANTWLPTMQVALCDGSTKSVSPLISPRTWALALHPADGVAMPADWDQ